MRYLLGYDIGSSSIKAALVEAESGKIVGQEKFPEDEMRISAPHPGWAEQDPEDWWKYLIRATSALLDHTEINPIEIGAIGISYQMHGLVLIDKGHQVIRPAIIWCDSRAAQIGEQAFSSIGKSVSLRNLLNSPGNFTASKLGWVKENEPKIFDRIYKVLLPGDFIAMKLTGEVNTTIPGLSEGIFWDFRNHGISGDIMAHFGFETGLLPDLTLTFGTQGHLTESASGVLGLPKGIPVSYRAGDQPNNAISLNVAGPGDVAANAGTSGVVYAVSDRLLADQRSRINSFAHVNYAFENPRIGILLCINGVGSQYRWMREQVAGNGISYEKMENDAGSIPVNSDGLRVIPFGNGAERIFENKEIGSQVLGLQVNRHTRNHLYRATLEGIAFSFVYGVDLLKELGVTISVLRVGNDNLFQSKIFSSTLCNLLSCSIEVFPMNGAAGAAKGAGVGINFYPSTKEAFGNQSVLKSYLPEENQAYRIGYEMWKADLKKFL